LDDLVEEIRRLLGFTSGYNSAEVDVDAIIEAMSKYVSIRSQWEKYALADLSRNYTRNGVDDMNEKANLLLLVWNPGKSSMIHDHSDAHCIMKILQGELVEQLYKWPENGTKQKMILERETRYRENEVTYISDRIGLHRICNGSAIKPAVSLHLYTPPYAAK
ncbi:RmlC-like cupin domain-containing protein, partial [Lipomyces arxii]|uniref:RmlC-like cupin domain-containing protein n=1 Tax=Lipomyces arxii TaxID=56418 RepID=UPI0034CFE049